MHPEGEVDWSESRGLHRGVFRGDAGREAALRSIGFDS
jgi:hypothetical protein